jgi:hypothetical protein
MRMQRIMKILRFLKLAIYEVIISILLYLNKRKLENKGNKHVFKCTCGKDITVMTNIYDNSNSGMGSCKCGATIYIN